MQRRGDCGQRADITEVDKLLNRDKDVACVDAGYIGVEQCSEYTGREVIWQIADRRSTYKQLSKRSVLYKARRQIEKASAGAGQGRASISGVLLHQSALLRLGQEPRTTCHLVRPMESMDSPPKLLAERERCALKAQEPGQEPGF